MPLHPQAAAFLQQCAAQKSATLFGVTPSGGEEPSAPPLERVEDHTLDGPGGPLAVRMYVPAEGEPPRGAVLYFHGGGWVTNSIETHDRVCRRLAHTSGCVVVSVEYRLAPRHKYPAALEDAYAAACWLASPATGLGIDPERIGVAGDSAGGNLAAALCLLARDRGGPALACQVLFYPITDHGFDTPSYHENAEGYFLTREQMRWFWGHYLADANDGDGPYASPLRGALHDLPPAFILTAEYDPLRDEGEAYAARLRAAGVAVTLRRYDGLIHGFIRRVGIFDAAEQAIADAGEQLRQMLALRTSDAPGTR